MASRKPDLKIPIPKMEEGSFQRPPSSVRSPRFIEDFDAPFSEALLDALSNASRTTLGTEAMSHPSTSTASRNSFGGESSRPQQLSKRQTYTQPPTPLRGQDSWGSDYTREATISGRVREWVKKSREGIRSRIDGKEGYFDAIRGSRGSIIMSPSQLDIISNELDGHQRMHSQATVSATELPPPTK